ncbi:glycoside hydrolase family 32 protein [Clostridium estertheticum]|uniref:glycoside hydrolase family 32 protein n=1 Tax=Clostridium estertheticum TaxID=238834 RepID=UPI001C6ED00B|nr:glycoside hydrolase family 32 protein [Clostridium estertheticum]MBW9154171.1 glycoside hydrolase family 32 protein [Clostridium estertheticum]WLC83825.1 glycoside hydrolase family 32 protein [Clostridium estertheticum]
MDLYKPQYHFMPDKNWMNDPNGPIYYKGKYHLFYQYNPNDYHWGTMHWGHAISEDLIQWKHLPIALSPSNELGETHCFSGCTVINNDGLPTIFYTSIGENERDAKNGAQQWMAVSHDDMLTWEKCDSNPVLKLNIHGEMDIKEWRDPFVWKENEVWYMVLGGGYKEKGCVLIYNSFDLKNWKFLNKMYEDPDFKFLECPNMLKFGEKYVLVYSPSDIVRYHVGTLNEDFTFTSEYEGILDNSGWEGFYAPNTLIDRIGRKIMWGWMTEGSRGEFDGANGWSGAQSIPRVLTLDSHNSLKMEPLPEYEMLRYDEKSYENTVIFKNKMIFEKRGRALEIELEIKINGDEDFSLNVLESHNEEEKTTIRYDAVAGEIFVDRSNSSNSEKVHKTILKSSLKKENGQLLTIRVFVDYSIIEVFADSEICLSTRIYPILESSENVSLELNKGNKLNIQKLNLWRMKSIW